MKTFSETENAPIGRDDGVENAFDSEKSLWIRDEEHSWPYDGVSGQQARQKHQDHEDMGEYPVKSAEALIP